MTNPGSLNAGMLRRGGRPAMTRPLALSEGVPLASPYASRIETMLKEARAEIGYDRPGFIRVEHPDDTVPGTLMGRFRVRVPTT
jgi:hypothetical protein